VTDPDANRPYLPAELKTVQPGKDGLRIQAQLVGESRARGGDHQRAGMKLDLVAKTGWFGTDDHAKRGSHLDT
jgi:hypothetical protein